MLVLLTSLAFAVDITVEGACPGEQTWTMTDLPDDGRLYLMAGTGPGAAPIPAGPCAGSSSGLAGPLKALAPLTDSDGDGVIVFDTVVPEAACSRAATAVSLSCDASAWVPVGGAECQDVCQRAVAAGCAVMDDCVDDCMADVDRCPREMTAVLECHSVNPIACDAREDQGIGQRGCVREHALAGDCGIDPF